MRRPPRGPFSFVPVSCSLGGGCGSHIERPESAWTLIPPDVPTPLLRARPWALCDGRPISDISAFTSGRFSPMRTPSATLRLGVGTRTNNPGRLRAYGRSQ